MARTFCHQLQFSHETSDPFSSAMNPLCMQLSMDTWAPIDASIALESAFDFVSKLSIFSTVLAGFAFAPGVCDPFPLNRLKKPREEGRALKGA